MWGDEFEALYVRCEEAKLARKVMKARELFTMILESQTETGLPYMMYKDTCNRKSNQQNLGTIRCSNLCTEIVEYTSPDEVFLYLSRLSISFSLSFFFFLYMFLTNLKPQIAVCNLASVALPMCVINGRFDFIRLAQVIQVMTRNLNRVIDITEYPLPEAKRSNLRHRPIGLGVQGLADTFYKLGYPFESPEASKLNRDIFETIYFAALTASKDLSKRDGPYETYPGSPISRGILQHDMWGVTPTSGLWDWDALRREISFVTFVFSSSSLFLFFSTFFPPIATNTSFSLFFFFYTNRGVWCS